MARQTTFFCFIRHGETDWNVERRIQGNTDIHLNATGRAQSVAVAEKLAHRPERFDHIISSDLTRAIETASEIARALCLSVERCTPIRERSYGLFEGMRIEELEACDPAAHALIKARQADFVIPGGGESLLDLKARVTRQLEVWIERWSGKNLIVVTHGGVIDIINRLVRGLALETKRDFPILNAGCNWVEYHPRTGWKIVSWGDPCADDSSSLELQGKKFDSISG